MNGVIANHMSNAKNLRPVLTIDYHNARDMRKVTDFFATPQQVPKLKQIQSTEIANLKRGPRGLCFGTWSLVLVCALEPGSWCFTLRKIIGERAIGSRASEPIEFRYMQI